MAIAGLNEAVDPELPKVADWVARAECVVLELRLRDLTDIVAAQAVLIAQLTGKKIPSPTDTTDLPTLPDIDVDDDPSVEIKLSKPPPLPSSRRPTNIPPPVLKRVP